MSELERLQADVDEIKTLLRRIDQRLTDELLAKQKKSGKAFRILVGTAAVLISAYGLLFIGLSLLPVIAGFARH
jgi:hypothetical protein